MTGHGRQGGGEVETVRKQRGTGPPKARGKALDKAPGGLSRRARRLARAAWRLLLCVTLVLALAAGIKTVQNRRDVAHVPTLEEALAALPAGGAPGAGFEIRDPYAVPGHWYKVQLHVHTDRSIDGKWTVEEALAAYAAKGYAFVAISDHDSITRPETVPEGLVVIPAEENTVAFPFWPLGHHAVLLFVNEHIDRGSARERFDAALAQGAVVSAAHPNWPGNLGSGVWEVKHLLAAPQITLMEVRNAHSNSGLDTAVWHEVVVRRGREAPVWAVAVDDSHHMDQLDHGWTMVKAQAQTLPALKEALLRGSLYPSTGPLVEFGEMDGYIVVASGEPHAGAGAEFEVRFIAASGDVVATVVGPLPARYRVRGDERFVRVEALDRTRGGKAWSQPFWIVARESAAP